MQFDRRRDSLDALTEIGGSRCLIRPRRSTNHAYNGAYDAELHSPWAIVFTGKCDVCRSFAFWCWDCGEKKVIPLGESYECGCERRWFTETTDDEVLFLVAIEDGEIQLDRRPLR